MKIKSYIILILSMCLCFSACQPAQDEDAAVKSLDELAGLGGEHPDCGRSEAVQLTSYPGRILMEGKQAVPELNQQAVHQIFSAIPVALQNYFIQLNGHIVLVNDLSAFAKKESSGEVLPKLDDRYNDESLIMYFSRNQQMMSLPNFPAGSPPEHTFFIALKSDPNLIKKNGVRAFANFIMQAPLKVKKQDAFSLSKQAATNAFLKELLAFDPKKISGLKAFIFDRGVQELEKPGDQPLSQLSFLNASEAGAANAAALREARAERFKVAVLGHAIDSLWCTAQPAKQPFQNTLALTDKAMKDFIASLGLGLGFDSPTGWTVYAQWLFDNAQTYAVDSWTAFQPVNVLAGYNTPDVQAPESY